MGKKKKKQANIDFKVDFLRVKAHGKKLQRPMLVGVNAAGEEKYLKWLSLADAEEFVYDDFMALYFGVRIEDQFFCKMKAVDTLW